MHGPKLNTYNNGAAVKANQYPAGPRGPADELPAAMMVGGRSLAAVYLAARATTAKGLRTERKRGC